MYFLLSISKRNILPPKKNFAVLYVPKACSYGLCKMVTGGLIEINLCYCAYAYCSTRHIATRSMKASYQSQWKSLLISSNNLRICYKCRWCALYSRLLLEHKLCICYVQNAEDNALLCILKRKTLLKYVISFYYIFNDFHYLFATTIIIIVSAGLI